MDRKKHVVIGANLLGKDLLSIEPYYDVTFLPWINTDKIPDENELISACKSQEVVVVYTEPVTEKCIVELKTSGLKLLLCGRATPNNIDWKAAKAHGIPIIYTPGRNAHAVAEYTVGMLLGIAKRIPFTYHALQSGRFLAEEKDIYDVPERKDVIWRFPDRENPRSSFPWSIDVYGRTTGIIGLGAIGQNVAKICNGLGMQVFAYDPYQGNGTFTSCAAVRCTDALAMLPRCDFVCVNLAPSESTYEMIDETWFDAMQNSACFINISRANVVKQSALIDALKNGKIAFAALDVMWDEPAPKNHPLLHMPNVVVTPHMAGISADVAKWASEMLADELIRYATGQKNIRVWRRE